MKRIKFNIDEMKTHIDDKSTRCIQNIQA